MELWRKTLLNILFEMELLPQSKMNDLLNDLSKITFHIEYKSVKEPAGECLKINLKNKDFIILYCILEGRRGKYSMVARFDENSQFIEHMAYVVMPREYQAVIDTYFD